MLRIGIIVVLWGVYGALLPHASAWVIDYFTPTTWLIPFILWYVLLSWPHSLLWLFSKNYTLTELLNTPDFEYTSVLTAILYMFVVLVYYRVKQQYINSRITIGFYVLCAYVLGYVVAFLVPFTKLLT